MAKKTPRRQLKVEYVSIDKIKQFKGNPRINDDNVAPVVKSIEAFGFVNPILVRRKNKEIIAGHTRIKAMIEHGEKKIPVIFLDMNEVDARVYNVFDNKSVENAKWDLPVLADLFIELDQLNVDMDLTGFTPDEISSIAPATFLRQRDDEPIPESEFSLIVECKNESEQKEVYDELTKRGLSCRVLTL